MAWIHISKLGMRYYDESVLIILATSIEKLIKVGVRTMKALRERYVKICVKLNLNNRLWVTTNSSGIL